MSNNQVQWSKLLNEAVNKEVVLSSAYSKFYNYSVGNQLLAWIQCVDRGIEVGPIATYKKWNELGRKVQKGAKAISLYIPSQFKVKDKDSSGKEVEKVIKYFALKPNWFVLSQTEGEDYVQEIKTPDFNVDLALSSLGITVEKFSHPNGNCQGYAKVESKVISVSPLAQFPHKTRIHEIAHCLLHSKDGGLFADGAELPKDSKEVEAESVAYIVISLLGLEGQKESRGYIQNWLGSNEIAEKSAQRIFGAVEKILKAGKPVETV
jgi:antirestriction protein ArdC